MFTNTRNWIMILLKTLESIPILKMALINQELLFCFLVWFGLVWLCQVLAATCRIFSSGVWALSPGMRELVPWPRIEPRPPALYFASIVYEFLFLFSEFALSFLKSIGQNYTKCFRADICSLHQRSGQGFIFYLLQYFSWWSWRWYLSY